MCSFDDLCTGLGTQPKGRVSTQVTYKKSIENNVYIVEKRALHTERVRELSIHTDVGKTVQT